MEVSLNIKDSYANQVLDFLKLLPKDVIEIEIKKSQVDDYKKTTKDEILADIKEGLKEVKLMREGKLKPQGSLEDLIKELESEN